MDKKEIIGYRYASMCELNKLLNGETIEGRYPKATLGKSVVCFFNDKMEDFADLVPTPKLQLSHSIIIKCVFNKDDIFQNMEVYDTAKNLVKEFYVDSYSLKNVLSIDLTKYHLLAE